MKRRRQLLAAVVAALTLAACGRQGALRLPDQSATPAPSPEDGADEDDDR
jgi:predicted small lipoprotein YifL